MGSISVDLYRGLEFLELLLLELEQLLEVEGDLVVERVDVLRVLERECPHIL